MTALNGKDRERMAYFERDLEHQADDLREVRDDMRKVIATLGRIENSFVRVETAITTLDRRVTVLSQRPPATNGAAEVLKLALADYKKIGVWIVCLGASYAVATNAGPEIVKMIIKWLSN